jgi:uncharacterized protein (TIGR00725 family)
MAAPFVAVLGAGDVADGSPEMFAAEAVGWGLATAGVTLVCGGLRGVMAGACRGAAAAGGTSIGLLPGTDRAAANDWVTIAIPTGLGEGRNLLVVRAADGVIAVGGGYGTLWVIGLALRTGLPVVGLDTWEVSRRGDADDGIVRAGGAPEAVATVLRLIEERSEQVSLP